MNVMHAHLYASLNLFSWVVILTSIYFMHANSNQLFSDYASASPFSFFFPFFIFTFTHMCIHCLVHLLKAPLTPPASGQIEILNKLLMRMLLRQKLKVSIKERSGIL
jgi:hypothetical protein